MDIRKLQRAIVDGLEDVKAHDIVIFNTEHLSPLFERVIIASGTSNRQTKALAASVRDSVKSRGMQVMRTEGEDNGEWIIVDCGAAVAHIMQPAIRTYYHLEEIWGDKPVRMKMDHSARPSAAPARDDEALAGEPARPRTRKPDGAGTAGAKPAVRNAAPPAPAQQAADRSVATGPASAKTTHAREASGAKAPVRRAPVEKAFVGTAPAKKAAAKKAPTNKAPTKKPAAKKAAAKKAPARQAAGRTAPARSKASAGKAPAKPVVTRTTGTKTAVRKAPAKRAATGRR
jgi:ribosome-associated protein